jgi:hypothetical protein
MLKIFGTICAALFMAVASPIAAQAQMDGGAHFSDARIGGVPFGGARFGAAALGARYYGGINRGAGLARHGGVYRGGVWPSRYGYYGNWRQSYWPYWGWSVAAGLLASAPTYYYGVGDEFGYEPPPYDGAIVYCMQRFRSYDPATGTYLGPNGYRHLCP